MRLTPLDWTVVGVSILVSFLPAIFFAKRAGSSTTEFFTSGRAAPWWLVGISMVATTFSTDTPNLVTNMVRENGVSDNWLWWSFLLTGMLTVFFYARMWRRSRDRKSTRLNSSHSSISYAVFCLKKKKKSTLHVHTDANCSLELI